jgi:hypothetical protein
LITIEEGVCHGLMFYVETEIKVLNMNGG